MDEERKIYEPAEASLDFEKRFGFPYETLADPEFIAQFQDALEQGKAIYQGETIESGKYGLVHRGMVSISGREIPVVMKVARANEEARVRLRDEMDAVHDWQCLSGDFDGPVPGSFCEMSSLQTSTRDDGAIEMLDLDRLGGVMVDGGWIPSENFFTSSGRLNFLNYLRMVAKMMYDWNQLGRYPIDVFNKEARVFLGPQRNLFGIRTYDYSFGKKKEITGRKNKLKIFAELIFTEDSVSNRPTGFLGAFPTMSVIGSHGEDLREMSLSAIRDKGMDIQDLRVATTDSILERLGFVERMNELLSGKSDNPFLGFWLASEKAQLKIKEEYPIELLEIKKDPAEAVHLLRRQGLRSEVLKRELMKLWLCSEEELAKILEQIAAGFPIDKETE